MRTLLICILIGLSPGYQSAVAQDEVRADKLLASPTPEVDPQFLLLPAFDLEQVVNPQAKNPVVVGDELGFRVLGIRLQGIENAWKQLEIGVPPGINLQNEGWDIQAGIAPENTAATEYLFQATPLKHGKLYLPSLALKDKTGKIVARTHPFSIEVASAIKPDDPKPDKPEELQPPVGLQFPFWLIVLGGILIFCALVCAGYAFYSWYRARKRKTKKIVEVIRPEDEVALTDLSELEQRGWLQKGQFKAYYFRVSEILKAYIGTRYDFDAPECTTRELLSCIEAKRSTPATLLDQLESLFVRLDRVKFTDYSPSLGEATQVMEEAKQFVSKTRRPPIITNPALASKPGVTQNAVR